MAGLRELPYVDGLVAAYLRVILPSYFDDVLVVTEMPDRDVRRYPLVLVTDANTNTDYDGRLARATLDVQVWSDVGKRDAADVIETIRVLLGALRRSQATITGLPDPDGSATLGGHLVGFNVQSSGPLPSGDTEAPWRHQLFAVLAVRPSG